MDDLKITSGKLKIGRQYYILKWYKIHKCCDVEMLNLKCANLTEEPWHFVNTDDTYGISTYMYVQKWIWWSRQNTYILTRYLTLRILRLFASSARRNKNVLHQRGLSWNQYFQTVLDCGSVFLRLEFYRVIISATFLHLSYLNTSSCCPTSSWFMESLDTLRVKEWLKCDVKDIVIAWLVLRRVQLQYACR